MEQARVAAEAAEAAGAEDVADADKGPGSTIGNRSEECLRPPKSFRTPPNISTDEEESYLQHLCLGSKWFMSLRGTKAAAETTGEEITKVMHPQTMMKWSLPHLYLKGMLYDTRALA